MMYRVLNRGTALKEVKEIYDVNERYDVAGKELLKNNIKVKKISLPNIRMIETQAFYSCTALRSIKFPRVVLINKEAFANCSNLREVVFPDCLERLGQDAFYKCKKVGTVSFAGNTRCKKIEDHTFAECRQLKKLILPEKLEEIGREAFYKCDELSEVRLPESLVKIGSRGFYQCGLETLELPPGLETIGESAFLKCKKLKYVRIPRSVNHIGKWAFHGCSTLEVLEIHHDPETVGEWITNKNCTIRCHKGSKMENYAEKFGIRVDFLNEKS